MGKVQAHMSMSLDGFVAGPDVSVEHPMGIGGERLHEWLSAEQSDPRDAEVAGEMFSPRTTGAVIMGRRTFEVGVGPWGEDGAFHLPCFVLTHRPAETLVKGATSFTFVTDGIESALARAQAAAAERAVNLMGATTTQQFLRAGLVDEIHINLVPFLLGAGIRPFEHIDASQVELQRTRLVESSAVTHLIYRIERPGVLV
jgi:dihydrofolate reductase